MHHFLRRISVPAGILSALLVGTLAAPAIADPGEAAPAAAAVPAPAPTSEAFMDSADSPANSEVAPPGEAAEAVRLCTFYTRGDYVHVSSNQASGHGWWVNVNCRATWAVVTVQLQQYYSDGRWRNIGTPGRATVRSGGGAGKRATGRVSCSSRSLTGWRSVVDVDVVGVLDDPRKLVTPARNIYCRR